MKKKIFVIMIIVLIACLITSCSPSLTPAPSPTPEKKERLIWSGFRVGTSFYFNCVGSTQLMNQYTDYISIIQPYPTPAATVTAVAEGKADIGILPLIDVSAYTMTNKQLYPKLEEVYPDLRFIVGSHAPFNQWEVGIDAKITKIADIKGHTAHWRTPGLDLNDPIATQSLRAVGVDPEKDVKHIDFATSPEALKALGDKKIDAYFGSLVASYVLEADAKRGLLVLDFPPEVHAQLAPWLRSAMIPKKVPAGHYSTIRKETWGLARLGVIFGTKQLPDEAAYQVAKLNIEKYKEVLTIHDLFRDFGDWDLMLPSELTMPVHEGSIRYFKEVGKWTPSHEAQQKQLLDQLQK